MENVDADKRQISIAPFLRKRERAWIQKMIEALDDQPTELDPWRFSRTKTQDYGHLYKQAHGYGAWRRQIALGRYRSAGDVVSAALYDGDWDQKIPQDFGLLRPKQRSVSTKNTASSVGKNTASSVGKNTASSVGNTSVDDSTACNDCASSAVEESRDPSEGWEEQVDAYGDLMEEDDGVSQLSDEASRTSIPEEDRLLQETCVAPFAFLQYAIEVSLTNCGLPSPCDCDENADNVAPKEDPSSLKINLMPHIKQVMETPFHREPEPIPYDVRNAEHRSPSDVEVPEAKKKKEKSNVFWNAMTSIHTFLCGSNNGPQVQDPTASSPWDLSPSEQTITDAVKMGMAVTAGSYRYAIDETNSLIDDFVDDHVYYFHDCVDTTMRAQASAPLMLTQRAAKEGKNQKREHGNRWKYDTPLPTEAGMLEIAECFSDTSLILMADLEGKIQNIRQTVNEVVEANSNFPMLILQNFKEIEGNDAESDQALGQKSRRADDEISEPGNTNKRRKIEFAPFRYIREAIENSIPRVYNEKTVSVGGAIEQIGNAQQESVTADDPQTPMEVEADPLSFPTSSDSREAHDEEAQRLISLIHRAFKDNGDPDVLDIVCDYSERFACGKEPERLTNRPNAELNIPGDKGSETGNKNVSIWEASKADGESMLEGVHTQMDGLKHAIGASDALNDLETRLQSFRLAVQNPGTTLSHKIAVDKVPPKSQDSKVAMDSIRVLTEELQSDRDPFMQKGVKQQEPGTMETISPDTSFQEPSAGHHHIPEPLSSTDRLKQHASGVPVDPVKGILQIVEDPHNPRYQGRRIRANDPPVYRPKGLLRKLKAAMKKNDEIVDIGDRIEGQIWTVSPRALEERKLSFGQSFEEDPEDNRDAAHCIPGGQGSSNVERDGRDQSSTGQTPNTDNTGKKNLATKAKHIPFDWRGDKKKLAVANSARFTKIVDTNHKMIEKRVSVDSKLRQGGFVSNRIRTLNSQENKSPPLKNEACDKRWNEHFTGHLDIKQDGRDVYTDSPVNVHRGHATRGKTGPGTDDSSTRLGQQRSNLSTESKDKPSITVVQDVLQKNVRNRVLPSTVQQQPPVRTRVTTLQGGGEIYGEAIMPQKSSEDRLGIDPFAPQHNVVILHSTRRHTPVVDVPSRGQAAPLPNTPATLDVPSRGQASPSPNTPATLDWKTPVSIPFLERQQSLTHQALAQLTHNSWATPTITGSALASTRAEATTTSMSFEARRELQSSNKKQQARKGLFGLLRTVVCKPRETKMPKME